MTGPTFMPRAFSVSTSCGVRTVTPKRGPDRSAYSIGGGMRGSCARAVGGRTTAVRIPMAVRRIDAVTAHLHGRVVTGVRRIVAWWARLRWQLDALYVRRRRWRATVT